MDCAGRYFYVLQQGIVLHEPHLNPSVLQIPGTKSSVVFTSVIVLWEMLLGSLW